MSKKDAYYFPHFINARNDSKILKLRRVLGPEGYAIYMWLLEVLREQSGMKYPLSAISELEFDFRTSKEKISTVIHDYDLFTVDDQAYFFSPKLIQYMQPYIEKSERARQAALIKWGQLPAGDVNADANASANADGNASPNGSAKGDANASAKGDAINKLINKEIKDNVLSVISFLNEKTGKSYKATSKATINLIAARLKDGVSIEELKSVIEKKAIQWLNDEKMAKYLRPETLFGNKFESYLNETKANILTPVKPIDHHEYIFGSTAN